MQCSLEYIWRPRPTPTGYQCALSYSSLEREKERESLKEEIEFEK